MHYRQQKDTAAQKQTLSNTPQRVVVVVVLSIRSWASLRKRSQATRSGQIRWSMLESGDEELREVRREHIKTHFYSLVPDDTCSCSLSLSYFAQHQWFFDLHEHMLLPWTLPHSAILICNNRKCAGPITDCEEPEINPETFRFQTLRSISGQDQCLGQLRALFS